METKLVLMIFSVVCLLVVFYVYFGYPVILEIFSRFSKRDLTIKVLDHYPDVSVLITGHNMAHLIAGKLGNLSKIEYPGHLQICFVLDGCTDDTEQLIETARSDYPFDIKIYPSPQRNGKEAAIRNAINQINTDVLVFSDADAFLRVDAIRRLVEHLSLPGVGAVSGKELHRKQGDTGASAGQGLFYHYEEFIKKRQNKLSSLCYVQGGNFAMWAKLYPKSVPPGSTQDGIIAFDVVLEGYRVSYEESAISEESYDVSNKDDYARRVRTVSRAFYSMLKRPNIFNPFKVGQFGFHVLSARLLRWFALPLALVGVLAGLVSGVFWYQILVGGGILLWCILLLVGWSREQSGRRSKIPYIVFYFTYIHVAAAWAAIAVLMGKRTVTWKPTN